MGIRDEAAVANRQLWEEEVSKGCGFTVPWLDLDVSLLRQYARGDIASLPEPWTCLTPSWVFAGVEGKDVLCLASGGGQQSAVFGLLGACVTVVDLAQGQLEGDERAAAHYGYPIHTVQADMRDLSSLDDGSFDLVYQADSFSYVPDVCQVYGEVSRVLRTGGIYRAKHWQPAIHRVDWDGEGYRITEPYAEALYRREDGGMEFRHYLDDVFNGLANSGLSLREVIDLGRGRAPGPEAVPGSWTHQEAYVGGGFVIVATKVGDHSRL
jgi:SAM-dependent methyltransferase